MGRARLTGLDLPRTYKENAMKRKRTGSDALRRALRTSLRAPEQRPEIGALWVRHNRDCDKWADDIERGVDRKWHHLIPGQGGMAIRTGKGRALIVDLFQHPEYWKDQGLYRKTKAFWQKWEGKPSQDLFSDSAKGNYTRYRHWERMVGY